MTGRYFEPCKLLSVMCSLGVYEHLFKCLPKTFAIKKEEKCLFCKIFQNSLKYCLYFYRRLKISETFGVGTGRTGKEHGH